MIEKNNQEVKTALMQVSNREVKSSAFTTYFSKPENAAVLYAALDGVEAIAPEDIEFTTLSGVLFMARKNDLAFTVKNKVLVISEHQSTINNNMPLRDAIYYGRTIERLIEPRALYRTKQIQIPTPEFYVFYNGNEDFPAEKVLKLSDAYIEKTGQPMLELIVKVININLTVNHPLLERCRPLYEYSWFIQRIKDHMAQGEARDEAIRQAMCDCRSEGIMEAFLDEHGSEAENMLFTEFNMEDALEVRFEEGKEEGREEGKEEVLVALVRKKFRKGMEAEQIAELLEEDAETVARICEVIRRNPDKEVTDICGIMRNQP